MTPVQKGKEKKTSHIVELDMEGAGPSQLWDPEEMEREEGEADPDLSRQSRRSEYEDKDNDDPDLEDLRETLRRGRRTEVVS